MAETYSRGAREGAPGPGAVGGSTGRTANGDAEQCLLCGDRIGAAEERRVRNGMVMKFCCYGCSINYELVQRLRGAWT